MLVVTLRGRGSVSSASWQWIGAFLQVCVSYSNWSGNTVYATDGSTK